MNKNKRSNPEVNAGSMADIAFLLLIFFLVTTSISTDKGLPMLLPPDERSPVDLHERNVYTILVNGNNQLLVENEPMSLVDLRVAVAGFLDNYGTKRNLSDNPQKAVVSIRPDRGTEYAYYIRVLDEVKASYQELRAKEVGMELEAFQALLDKEDKLKKSLIKKIEEAREKYPMRISEAEIKDI